MHLKVEKLVYGGDGLARLPVDEHGPGKAVFLPFVLEEEEVEADCEGRAPSRNSSPSASGVELSQSFAVEDTDCALCAGLLQIPLARIAADRAVPNQFTFNQSSHCSNLVLGTRSCNPQRIERDRNLRES